LSQACSSPVLRHKLAEEINLELTSRFHAAQQQQGRALNIHTNATAPRVNRQSLVAICVLWQYPEGEFSWQSPTGRIQHVDPE